MLPYGCYMEVGEHLSPQKLSQIAAFLTDLNLDFDRSVDFSVAVFSPQGQVIATASLQRNTLKCIGISPAWQGEGLTASLMTCLLERCAAQGYPQQFLYTKPKNAEMFLPFGFSVIARTQSALLMEHPASGIQKYLAALPTPPANVQIGAIVAHCNPITNGHLYLIRQAYRQCGFLYVFILSEDQGEVPADDRLMLVRKALAGYKHLAVCPTGQYLISNATFPSYFLRNVNQVQKAWCEMDIQIFARWFVPALRISSRFIGTEPFSPVTATYNQQMKEILPKAGVKVVELARKTYAGAPISASRVRQLLREKRLAEVRDLVPSCTFDYFSEKAACAEAMKRLSANI